MVTAPATLFLSFPGLTWKSLSSLSFDLSLGLADRWKPWAWEIPQGLGIPLDVLEHSAHPPSPAPAFQLPLPQPLFSLAPRTTSGSLQNSSC